MTVEPCMSQRNRWVVYMKKSEYFVLSLVLLMVVGLVDCVAINRVSKSFNVNTIAYNEGNDGSNYLSSVHITGVNVDFRKDKQDYYFEVPYSKTKLGLTYTPEDTDAIVEVVGGDDLYIGNNSIAIIVTSTGGITREYDFTIVRSGNNENVSDSESSIRNSILNSTATNIGVNVTDNAAKLEADTINTLITNRKSLVYTWKRDNKFFASLSIDGTKVENVNGEVNPNVKSAITNVDLLKEIKGYDYTPVSTVGTNIPKGSIYKITVNGSEDLYYLYYYENDILVKKPLRNIDGTVEFELDKDTDYALMNTSNRPTKKSDGGFSWIWPSIILTLLIGAIYLGTKGVMVKIVRNSHSSSTNDVENSSKVSNKDTGKQD